MDLDILPPEIRLGVQSFIKRYNPKLTVDSFHPKGMKFEDSLDQTIVLVPATLSEGYLAFTNADADIFVLCKDELILGWAHKSSLIKSEMTYMLPVRSLSKMPKELKFAQECKHLAYFGGFKFQSEYVTCYGCGKQIV